MSGACNQNTNSPPSFGDPELFTFLNELKELKLKVLSSYTEYKTNGEKREHLAEYMDAQKRLSKKQKEMETPEFNGRLIIAFIELKLKQSGH